MQVHWAHRFFLFLFLLAIRTEAVIFVAARPGLCRRSGEGQKREPVRSRESQFPLLGALDSLCTYSADLRLRQRLSPLLTCGLTLRLIANDLAKCSERQLLSGHG